MRGSGIPGVLGFSSDRGGDKAVGQSLSARKTMAQSFVVAGTFEVEGNSEKLMIFESSCASVICRREGANGGTAGVLWELRHELVFDHSGWTPR
jgi:hypothetical protein